VSRPPATAVPNRRAAGAVLTAVCGSALVVNANTAAVTTLIPSIRRVLNAPVAPPQWAVTGCSLQGATVIVTSGALGDVLGRRKVFPAGLALFVGSCALIALSANGVGVVGRRMIQGASGAMILACSSPLSRGRGRELSHDPDRTHAGFVTTLIRNRGRRRHAG
jgi:MFS family permease